MSSASPRIALIYDWVTTPYGGAENVLQVLHELYPQAPLYTSVFDPARSPWAADWTVRPSFLQKIPGARLFYRYLAPLMPLAFENLNLDQFDVIISVTSGMALGVLTKPHQLHVCYILTPPRYLYSHEAQYERGLVGWPVVKEVAQGLRHYLRWWMSAAAYRPDYFIPISRRVSDRVNQFYQRPTSPVIYPPVEVAPATENSVGQLPASYYLVVSRLVDYKRIDLAIAACQQLDQPLVIVGKGPAAAELHRLASASPGLITFLGALPATQIPSLYQRARALLMPGEEDFGITALEAVGQGVPAILHQQSGAAELLEHKVTALFLKETTKAEIVRAILTREKQTFNPQRLRKTVANWGVVSFKKRFADQVNIYWNQYRT